MWLDCRESLCLYLRIEVPSDPALGKIFITDSMYCHLENFVMSKWWSWVSWHTLNKICKLEKWFLPILLFWLNAGNVTHLKVLVVLEIF